MKKLLTLLVVLSALPFFASAQTTGQFIPFLRFTNATGTQATTTRFAILGLLGCNTSSALTTNASGSVVCGPISGSGTVAGGSDTQVQFNDGGTNFGGNANLTFSKGTGLLTGLSSLFTFTTTTNFLATGSSTIQSFTFTTATGTSATTTSFFSTTASSTNLFGSLINGFGLLTCNGTTGALSWAAGKFGCGTIAPPASAITNGAALTKTDDTNVTLTLGGSPSTALLAATSLTLGWTGTLADSRVADNLTINGGTVDNSVIGGTTAAAGTFTNLLVTGSSTLQKFTFTNATGSQATTTGFAATTICFTGDTCRTTWPTGGSSASSTLLGDNNGFTGLNTFSDLKLVTRSTTTQATTTNLAVTTLCLTGDTCRTTWPTGGTGVTSIATNNGITGGTITTTGTLSLDQTFGAIWTAASSTFVNGVTFGTSTTTSATTTNFNTTNASTSQLVVSNSPSALLLTGATGLVGKYGGASACGANNFVTALSAVGGTTCGTGTISGISIGSNLASLSHDSTFSGTSYNGSAAVSDWGINLTTGNIWTAASTTFVNGVTFGKSTTTNATTTGAASIGFASTTNLRIDTAKSALLLTNSSGDVSGYGGASACSSNNFVTALSAVGGTTCGTSTISGVSLGGTLAALTAGTTLTSGGTYTGATGRTFDIDLTHANTWTGNQMFVASTTIGGGTAGTGLTVAGTATTTNLLVTSSSTLQSFTFTNATGSLYQLTGTSNPPVLGLYSAATNQIDFSTASIWRGGFTSNGRFDIGTSTPTFDLTVASTSPTFELDDTDGATNQKHLIQSFNSGIFAVGTSSDTTLTSTSTLFSINSTQPTSFLFGTSTATTGIFADWFSTASTSLRLDSNSTTKGGCIVMKDTDGVGYTYVTANNGVLTASQTSCL